MHLLLIKRCARSSAGSIEFTGALSKGESRFRTSVESIKIALLGEPNLTVETSTRIGRVTCTPELNDARYEGADTLVESVVELED